uniref:Signal-induced proliferation-associated 1 n=1 Tax=Gallus gallus TaxID=9031 RepID=A0A8V0X346_CHICK
MGDPPEFGTPPHPPPDAEDVLVLSCPRFICEVGGEKEEGLGTSPRNDPPGLGYIPNAAVAVLEEPPPGERPPHAIEHCDGGAGFYRKYFYGKEHLNFLGEDERWGPMAVSVRREERGLRVLHRVIVRTGQLRALRASVLEEALPPHVRPPGSRGGVPPRRLLELLLPGGGAQVLRLADPSPTVPDTLLKVDEQGVCLQRKVGVLYCRGGQSSEEEMYNNESAEPPFQEFLALLGTRVRLRGFRHYRAQLDTKTDSTGTHSLYTTYHGYEVMFHVSTMLPFTPTNPQQLLRKRHIGNDIVTIIFQEPGALPFSPRAIRSHFQHVFIVVRVHQPCTPHTSYSVAVTRSDDTPPFGPPIAVGQRFPRGPQLRHFLLAKAINGENAASRGGRLGAMAARTRHQYLRELARSHANGPPPRRPHPVGVTVGGDAVVGGALVWGAKAWVGQGGEETACLLGVAAERVVLVTPQEGRVLLSAACRDVLGWAYVEGGVEIFYGAGESVGLRLPHGEAEQVVARLQAVTRGCEVLELSLPRGAGGRLGFRIARDGVVTSVQRFSFAEVGGLRRGARVLRVAHSPLPNLTPQTLRALLRGPKAVLTILPPDRDGRPRRSFSELYARSLEQGQAGGRGSGGGDIGDSSSDSDSDGSEAAEQRGGGGGGSSAWGWGWGGGCAPTLCGCCAP